MTTTTTTDVEIRTISEISELMEMGAIFQQVWGAPEPLVSTEFARAISHSGGYVAGAFVPSGQMVGASLGILARHGERAALHSHLTGLLDSERHRGIGRAIKLHQRAWAIEHGIECITWTFDPLVRRNAWFNIAVLGADADDYLPSFYGEMTDEINAGDESDRLHVTWDVTAAMPERVRDGGGVVALATVPTPVDVVELRRTDAAAVARWRRSTRNALLDALGQGHRIVGFTRDGDYVIGSNS